MHTLGGRAGDEAIAWSLGNSLIVSMCHNTGNGLPIANLSLASNSKLSNVLCTSAFECIFLDNKCPATIFRVWP